MANTSGRIIGATLAAAMGYAVIRYHIAGDVPWKDFPFFILNKGIALGAFVLVALNFGLGPAKNLGMPISESWLDTRKALGMTGFLLVLIHALMSFVLLSPSVYRSFYEADGTLTGFGGISILAGILAFVFLWAFNLSFQSHLREDKAFISFITSRKCLVWALLLGGIHLLFMGYAGWMTPSAWNGGLPPISLIAFIFFVLCYFLNLLGRE